MSQINAHSGKKKKYAVSYSEDHLFEIIIEAHSAEEAREIVQSGNFEYRGNPDGITFLGINNVTEVNDEGSTV